MKKHKGRKKLTIVGPHLGGKHKGHKGKHKGGKRKHGGRK